MNEKKQFNVAVYFLWFFLIFVPPLGLLMLWVGHYNFSKVKKFLMSLAFCLYFVIILAYASSIADPTDGKVAKSTAGTTSTTEKDVPKTEAPKTETPKVDVPKATLGQKNALKKALIYLETAPFSYLSLIDQLTFESFSVEDATYAADNCKADWNEQAAKKAKVYIDMTALSKQALIDQLVFEKFTAEQAAFGAAAVGY